MNTGGLTIDRVRLAYEAATTFDRAERVTRRISEAISRSLPGALATAAAREIDTGDGYVFVERIEVQSSVASHWSDERIADHLAGRIASTLSRTLALGGALAFRDRAEYLGAFAISILEPGASRRWWFAEFEGLGVLPLSARIRTLILSEGIMGFQALARLSDPQLHRILGAIEEADVARLLDQLPDVPVDPPAVQMLVGAAQTLGPAPLPSANHHMLAMLVHLVRAGGGEPSRAALKGLQLTSSLIRAAQGGILPPAVSSAAATLRRWLQAIGRDADAAQVLFPREAQRLVDHVARHISAAVSPGASATRQAQESFDFTPFGGALLLCVVLVRMGWGHAWQDAFGERPEAPHLAAALALMVVARALDPRSAAMIETNATLRRAFMPEHDAAAPLRPGERRLCARVLKGAPVTAALCATRRGLDAGLRACAAMLLTEFAKRVPGCDGSTPAYIRRQILSMHAGISADGGNATLGRPPLDILLVFSGLKRASVTLPHGRTLSLSGETLP